MGAVSREGLRAVVLGDMDPETRRIIREAKEKEGGNGEGEGGDG